jgi:hypothetical protein
VKVNIVGLLSLLGFTGSLVINKRRIFVFVCVSLVGGLYLVDGNHNTLAWWWFVPFMT